MLKEGVHDVGSCGRIAGQDNNPNFFGTRELSSAHCRWRVPLSSTSKPVAASLLALASTVYVKEVTLDLVEKSACIESGSRGRGT